MHRTLRATSAHIAWLLPVGVLFFACGILLGRTLHIWLPGLGILALALIAARLSGRWLRTLSIGMVILAAGTILGWHAYHPALPAEGRYTVQATVAEELQLREDGQVQTVLTDVTLDGQRARNAYWTFYVDEGEAPPEWLVPGVRLTMQAGLYHPSRLENPGGFSFQEYLLQRNIALGLYGADGAVPAEGVTLKGRLAALRHSLSSQLQDVMGEEAGAYAAAILLGVKTFIPEDERALFRELGIAHILSISGFHVGVLGGLLSLLLLPLSLRRGLRFLLEAAAFLAYCVLTGGNAPVIRASMLMLCREYVLLRNRQHLPLHLLSATAFLQLLFNPTQLTAPSFHLTYGAMLGIVLIGPRLKRLHTFSSPPVQWLWKGFCTTLAAQLGVLLPQLYWFGTLPLLAILYNTLLIPLFTALMYLYWMTLLTLPVPVLRETIGTLASGATTQLLDLIRILSAGNLSALWTRQPDVLTFAGWILLLLSFSGLLPGRYRRCRRHLLLTGLLLIALLLVPLPQRDTVYLQFSVGNADAALLQDRDMTVVIDTGEDGRAIANHLHRRRQKVELLIVTHLHVDHGGGIRALLDQGIPVEVCCLPWDAEAPMIDEEVLPLLDELRQTGTEILYLCRGDVIDLPSGQLTVLWPLRDRVSTLHDANDAGLVLQAEISGVTMLLTGDLSSSYTPYIAQPADILKAPHHGSKAANTADFIASVSPQLILQSNRLESRELHMADLAGDIPLYATEEHGAITIRFLGDGEFTVETVKQLLLTSASNHATMKKSERSLHMPFVPAKCTECGAILKVDQSKDAAICQHCGAAFVVEKAINNYTVHNHINADTVNVYEQKDFVIRAGVLERYQGEATDVVVPDNVIVIGEAAFKDLIGLRSVVIPDSVTLIGPCAFMNCPNLTHVSIGASVREIGTSLSGRYIGHSFDGCISLREIDLSGSIQKLALGTFYNCKSLERIVIPSNIDEVDSHCFSKCNNLKTVIIQSTHTTIQPFAFGESWVGDKLVNCPALVNVHLPNGANAESYYPLFRGTPWGESELAKLYRSRNVCAHCGGPFKGLFKKFCTKCNKEKDY